MDHETLEFIQNMKMRRKKNISYITDPERPEEGIIEPKDAKDYIPCVTTLPGLKSE